MVVTCWSVKGGSGTTVVAAMTAVAAARQGGDEVLLVDLAGDAAAALGLADAEADGLGAWLATPGRHADDAGVLGRLERRVDERLSVLPWGSIDHGDVPNEPIPTDRVATLLTRLSSDDRLIVVDAGSIADDQLVGPLDAVRRRCIATADRSLLVVRCCYLTLRRAARSSIRPDGVVVVTEPGRALTPADVESVLGVPVLAQLAVDAQVARVVDAGLLASRLGRGVERALLDLVQT